MANILDLTLLKEFSQIFVWLLIFVVSYGILQAANIFHSKGLHALIALALTVLIGTTGSTSIITSMTPWFVILGFFLVFLLVLGQFIGLKQADVLSVFSGKGVMWYLFAVLAIGTVIALVSAGQHQGESKDNKTLTGGAVEGAGEAQTQSQTPGQTIINVLTNPKVLGLILILAIAIVTVALMAGGSSIA